MKKHLILIAVMLAAILPTVGQDNRPGGYDATAFKLSNFVQTIIVEDDDYVIPSPLVVEVWNNGLKLSDSTDVTVSGDTIRFTLTPGQLAPLIKAPVVYLKDGDATVDPYLLAINVTVKTGYAVPTGSDKRVYIKSMGNIRVSWGENTVVAISAANRATAQVALAVTAKNQAVAAKDTAVATLLNRMRIGTMSTLRALTESFASFEVSQGGRSGIFYYDPTDSTTPDDSARTIVRSDGKRFKRPDAGYIMPEWYGAVGDGVTDDTNVMKRVLGIGGEVIASRKYKITSAMNIILSGGKVLTIRGGGEFSFNGLFNCLSATGSGSLIVADMRFTGTMSANYDGVSFAIGVYGEYLNTLIVKNSVFKNIYGDGIRAVSVSQICNVENNTILNCAGLNPNTDLPSGLQDHYGDGILIYDGTKRATVRGNYIIHDPTIGGFYGRCGIAVDGQSSAEISNNKVVGYSRGIHLENSADSKISSNQVTGNPSALIISYAKNMVIDNNYFSNEGTVTGNSVVSLYLINNYASCENITYLHNVFKVDTTAIKVPTTAFQAAGSNYLLENNKFDTNEIYLYQTSGYVFNNNTIKASKLTLGSFPIGTENTRFYKNRIDIPSFVTGGTSATFIENEIYNSRGSQGLGTLIGYNAKNFALIRNTITDPKAGIILNDGGEFSGEISGNKLVMLASSTATPWAVYPSYLSRVPVFSREKNYLLSGGVTYEGATYYTAKYESGGYTKMDVTTTPTTGSWSLGDRWDLISPVAGGSLGGFTTVAGTFGTLNAGSTTGGITSGTKTLTVNSATGITPGVYLTIAGVSGVKKVTAISGTTVTIDSNASATVSGAAVAYSAPTFKTYGAVAP